MIAVINYQNRLRVVFILGQEGGHYYCLASEKIPEKVVPPLSKILYSIEDLGKRIEILRDEFAPIYKTAFRKLKVADVSIVEVHERPQHSN